jgi:hypothetical protein
MSGLERLCVGGLLLVGWFMWAGPEIALQLRTLRAQGPIAVSSTDLARTIREMEDQSDTSLPSEESLDTIRGHIEHIHSLDEEEEQLVSMIWSIVPESQKEGAIELSKVPTPTPLTHDARFLEPETPALIAAIIAQHGYAREIPAKREVTEPHIQVSRMLRLRATRAVVNAGGLEDETAAIVLDASLRLAETQRRRVAAERELAGMLPETIRTAAAAR